MAAVDAFEAEGGSGGDLQQAAGSEPAPVGGRGGQQAAGSKEGRRPAVRTPLEADDAGSSGESGGSGGGSGGSGGGGVAAAVPLVVAAEAANEAAEADTVAFSR